jgi:hypothetical protein
MASLNWFNPSFRILLYQSILYSKLEPAVVPSPAQCRHYLSVLALLNYKKNLA